MYVLCHLLTSIVVVVVAVAAAAAAMFCFVFVAGGDGAHVMTRRC